MNRQINGTAVREFRKTKQIRASDLALRAGLSTSYLSNIEAGRKQPAQGVMERIAGVLGVPVEAITYPATGRREQVAA